MRDAGYHSELQRRFLPKLSGFFQKIRFCTFAFFYSNPRNIRKKYEKTTGYKYFPVVFCGFRVFRG